MKIAIHQPNYLPNLGYFHKMNLVDRFIVITNLQFERQEGWQRRHKIKGPTQDHWLTVPTLGSRRQLISEVKLDNTRDWSYDHKRTIMSCYSGKTKYKDILERIIKIYDEDWQRLAELNFAIIKLFSEILEIKSELIFDEESEGKKWELLINVCKRHEATTYISGIGAKDYMTDEYFNELNKNNINHQFIEHNTTADYPYSTLHYLLTEGPEWCKQVINS